MPRRSLARVASLASVALAGTFAAAAGCTESQDCSCDEPAVTVEVVSTRAAEVKSVTGGGPACSGVTATCDVQGNIGCARYAIVPTQAGECDVTVTFVDGTTQSGSYTFGGGAPTCCGDLSGGGQLDITPPAALADADAAPDASADANASLASAVADAGAD